MKNIIIFLFTFLYVNLSSNQAQESDSTKTITVKVKGITCSNDLKTIASNVEKIKGVSYCKSGKMGPTSTFEVKFNTHLISEKEIHSTIENTGGCENPNDRPYKVK